MTIYFAGGEDIDFLQAIVFGGLAFDTGASWHRTEWSRGGLTVLNILGAPGFPGASIFASYWVSPPFTPLTDFWFHSQVVFEHHETFDENNLMGFGSADNVWRLAIQGTGNDGQFKLVKRDNAGALTTLATSDTGLLGAVTFTIKQLDIHIDYNTSGSVEVYFNGSNTPIMSYAGDVTTNSATSLNQFFMGTHLEGSIDAWSEIIVSDLNTRSMSLLSRPPVAPGNTQDWTGSVSDINEDSLDVTTFITTPNNNDLSEWTTSENDVIPVGSWDVQAVIESVDLNIGSVGPQNFEFVIRPATGSSDYFSSSIPGSASFDKYSYIWQQNPGTSSAWNLSDIDTGYNIGLKAIA